jgi:hypothetical protein
MDRHVAALLAMTGLCRLSLDRHQLAHAVLLHLAAQPLSDELAALHHQVIVGQFLGIASCCVSGWSPHLDSPS